MNPTKLCGCGVRHPFHMSFGNRASNLVLAVLCLLAISPAAFAYIDAGSGSYLLQVMIAGVLGALFMAKNWFGMVRAKFAKRK